MNKIFKVIYSKTRHCYVVVSELAKSHCKTAGSHTVRNKTTLTAAVLLALGTFSVASVFMPMTAEAVDQTKTDGSNFVGVERTDGLLDDSKYDNYGGKGANGADSITLGLNAQAGAGTITIGDRNAGASLGSVYVGQGDIAKPKLDTGGWATSIGYNSDATGYGSIALGSNAVAKNSYAKDSKGESLELNQTYVDNGVTKVRLNSKPDIQRASVAIGYGASADNGNIAIGSYSDASTDLRATTGDAAEAYLTAKTADSYVSVGKTDALRRISNVADGAADSDVATIGQLKALSDKAGVYNEGWGINIADEKDEKTGAVTKKNVISLKRNLGTNYTDKEHKGDGKVTVGVDDTGLVLGGYAEDDPGDKKNPEVTYGATGDDSVTVGGKNGLASGKGSVAAGGMDNVASGVNATVVGGDYNDATGKWSAALGGRDNTASGEDSTATGGGYNVASGTQSAVLGGYSNYALGTGTTSIGGYGKDYQTDYDSSVNGMYSVGIAGGSTGKDAAYALAAGNQAVVTTENGTAIGYQATTDEANTIAFGHDVGDVSGYTIKWKQRTDGKINADNTTNDYTQAPESVTENTYTTAGYNRLVKVADGKDDHDVVVMEQLKDYTKTDASNIGNNIKVYKTDGQGNVQLGDDKKPIEDKNATTTAQNTNKNDWAAAIGDGVIANPEKEGTNDPTTNGSQRLVTGGTVYKALQQQADNLKVNAGWGINVADEKDDNGNVTKKNVISLDRNLGTNLDQTGHVYLDVSKTGLVLGTVVDGAPGTDVDLHYGATGDYAVTVGGGVNTASGKASVVLGGSKNTASNEAAVSSGGSSNVASGSMAGVYGGFDNEASETYAAIFAGAQNKASNMWTTVGGGALNEASGTYASIWGGYQNKATDEFASVYGGLGNSAYGPYSTILGGGSNKAGSAAVVSGGVSNEAAGLESAVVGGEANIVTGANATALGGIKGSVNGAASVGILGGSTGMNAPLTLAAGYQSTVTDTGVTSTPLSEEDVEKIIEAGGTHPGLLVSNNDIDNPSYKILDHFATAIGYQATADEAQTVAFGHDKGDTYYGTTTYTWKQKATVKDGHYYNEYGEEIDENSYKSLMNADGTWNDYSQPIATIEEKKYDSAYYNRLVKVADGIDDHDVVVMEQLKQYAEKDASNIGNNLTVAPVYQKDDQGNIKLGTDNKPLVDEKATQKKLAEAQAANKDAWGKALGAGTFTTGTSDKATDASTSDQLVTGKTLYDYDKPTGTQNYVKANNTTGQNLSALDAQVKANADTLNDKTHNIKYYSVNDTALPKIQGKSNEDNKGAMGMGSIAAGFNTHADGIASTVAGSYSGVINQNGNGGLDLRGATALSYGTFNINQNTDATKEHSGVANSIVGQANATTDSNAAIIYGAGNTVTNSYRAIDTSNFDLGKVQQDIAKKDAAAVAKDLQAAVSTSGAQVMVMGGGNSVDKAYMTQVTGVGNKVSGQDSTYAEGTSTQYNFVDGFQNELTNGKHDYIIGSKNKVSGDSVDQNQSNIIFGNNHKLTNQKNNVIIGSSDTADDETAVSDIVAIGHNAKVSAEGGVAIGSGSEASVAGKKTEGYDPTTGKDSTDTTATWQATNAAVSIGKADGTVTRQLNGVAAGTNDTDAVNVAQLKKLEGMKANIDASNIGKNITVAPIYKDDNGTKVIDQDATKKAEDDARTANENAWGTAIGTGKVADPTQSTTNDPTQNGSQQLITGGEVYKALHGGLDDVVFGHDGKDGKDGSIGLVGPKGENGKDGKTTTVIKTETGAAGVNGKDGKDGKDGITRIYYYDQTNTNDKHTVATLDDGMKFGDDFGNNAKVKLDQQLDIVGDINAGKKDGDKKATQDDLSDGNIGVIATDTIYNDDGTVQENGKMTIKLTKDLKNLHSSTYTTTETTGEGDQKQTTDYTTTVDSTGVTIKSTTTKDGKPETVNGPSMTKDGIDGGGKQITNVGDGFKKNADGSYTISETDKKNAANIGDVQTIVDKATKDLTDGTNGLNSKANVDASNIGSNITVAPIYQKDEKGQDVIGQDGQKVIDQKATEDAEKAARTANENAWGTAIGAGEVAKDNGQLVTGKTVYEYDKPIAKDGKDLNYVSERNTTGRNLGALDTQVKKNADDITNINKSISTLDQNAVKYDDSSKSKVTLGGESGTTITNVKDGALSDSSTDAVNGKQLYSEQNARQAADTAINNKIGSLDANGNYIQKDASVSSNLSTLDTQVKANADAISKETSDRKAADAAIHNKIGSLDANGNYIKKDDSISQNLSTLDTQVKNNADAIQKNSESIQNITNNVKNLSDNAVQYDKDSNKSKVTLAGKDGTTITNVKAGTLSASSTDAVNGKQLYNEQQAREAADTAITEKVTNNTSEITKIKNGDFTDASKTAIHNIAKDAVEVVDGINTKAVKIEEGTDTTPTKYAVNVEGKGKVASGDTGLISGDTLYKEVHVDKDGSYIKGSQSVGQNLSALDTGLKTTSDLIHTNDKGDTIQIGGNSTATKIDISGKDANGNTTGRVITGVVSDANDPNSAANVGYVNGLTAANTQQIYRDMNNAYSRLDTNINRAAAGSNALAALHPLDFDPADKASFAVGYGHYHNANAAAVGAFYQPNANTMVNMGISLGNGDPGFNAGVSFKIGKGSAYNGVSKAEMAQTIHDQAAEISTIKANDAAKDKRIDALEKENQEMKKQIQEILARLNG